MPSRHFCRRQNGETVLRDSCPRPLLLKYVNHLATMLFLCKACKPLFWPDPQMCGQDSSQCQNFSHKPFLFLPSPFCQSMAVWNEKFFRPTRGHEKVLFSVRVSVLPTIWLPKSEQNDTSPQLCGPSPLYSHHFLRKEHDRIPKAGHFFLFCKVRIQGRAAIHLPAFLLDFSCPLSRAGKSGSCFTHSPPSRI